MRKKRAAAQAPLKKRAARAKPARVATKASSRKSPAATTQLDVDRYLAAVPAEARAALMRLREVIRAAAPKATEVISYRIPIFKHKGPLVGFAAFDDHCGFYVMSVAVMRAHAAELQKYPTGKGSIRFPASKPLPAALVKRLVQARIAENDARRKR